MIFKKPSKTGSVLHDTLAFENGDTTINVSALDIDGNRVGTEQMVQPSAQTFRANQYANGQRFVDNDNEIKTGRYPAQTFIDNQVAEILDEQSGVSNPKQARTGKIGGLNGATFNFENGSVGFNPEYIGHWPQDDGGGASKILHKCNYEQDDVTLYHYEPKVSGSERNAGLGGFDTKSGGSYEFRQDGSLDGVIPSNKNNHPTLKPIELNYRILKLFKLPTDQKICYPFAGSGSEIIGGIKAGFENWVGCEINAEYVAIANARINYWKETMWEQQSLFDEVI
jgi:hypothetical protein